MSGFRDRVDAGRQLAARLGDLRGEHVVVIGLPRGGVVVAAEVAAALGAPLDVALVRKLGVPFQPELAMGAIAEGDVEVIDDDTVKRAGVRGDELDVVRTREGAELARRSDRYRAGRPALDLTDRTAVIVDDGLATGATARVAVRSVRARGARRVVVAVPVASSQAVALLEDDGVEVVAQLVPRGFYAVGAWYEDFAAVVDDEVEAILSRTT